MNHQYLGPAKRPKRGDLALKRGQMADVLAKMAQAHPDVWEGCDISVAGASVGLSAQIGSTADGEEAAPEQPKDTEKADTNGEKATADGEQATPEQPKEMTAKHQSTRQHGVGTPHHREALRADTPTAHCAKTSKQNQGG